MEVTVMGSGAFGLSIAYSLHKNGHNVTMWTSSPEKAEIYNAREEEIVPGVKIPDGIKFTASYKEALENTDTIFIMTAAKYIGDVAKKIKKYVNEDMHFCIGSKGIEQGSCKFVHQIFTDHIKTKNLSVISGPSFAIDILNDEPIGLSIASLSIKSRNKIINTLVGDTLKLRSSSDIVGLEICGSIKNVIAVASGILEGLGFSESTRSFLIVESMHDIKELINGLGGKRKTILSFAGIGDLMLTCTSVKSRNFSYGIYLGKKDYDGAKEYLANTTVEGYYTLKSIYTLLKRKKIKMPVIDLIYKIVMENEDPQLLVNFLITKK